MMGWIIAAQPAAGKRGLLSSEIIVGVLNGKTGFSPLNSRQEISCR